MKKKLIILSLPLTFLISCKKTDNPTPGNQQTSKNVTNVVTPTGDGYVSYVMQNSQLVCQGTYDSDMNLTSTNLYDVNGNLATQIIHTFTGGVLYQSLITQFTSTGISSDVNNWKYTYGNNTKVAQVTTYENSSETGYSVMTYDNSNNVTQSQSYTTTIAGTQIENFYTTYQYSNSLLTTISQVYPATNQTYIVDQFAYDQYGNVLTINEANDSMVTVIDTNYYECYVNNMWTTCPYVNTYQVDAGVPSRKIYLKEQFYYDYKYLAPSATVFKALTKQASDFYKFVHAPSSIIEYLPTGGVSSTTSFLYSDPNTYNYPTNITVVGNGLNNTYVVTYVAP